MIGLLLDALAETLAMVGVSLTLAALAGIPLGVALLVTARGAILERPLFNRVLGAVVNATRSTPFIILMVAIIPLTRLIVGTSIGTAAATVPLVIAAVPFVARLVEASLREVDGGLVEAAQATRVVKTADGGKSKEVFDIAADDWRPARPVTVPQDDPLFDDSAIGRFAWDLTSETLAYAADLLPAIADDIVNVDRAMRWGFAWTRGPFEWLDHLGPQRVIARLRAENRKVPKLLALLESSGAASFYRDGQFLGLDGKYHPVPAE